MLKNISLRHLIPLLFFSGSLMLVVFFYTVGFPVAQKEAVDLSKRQALTFLQIQQSRFIELLYLDDTSELEKEIYFANNDPAIKRLFIVDENLIVQYSNRSRNIGEPLSATNSPYTKAEIDKVNDTLTLSVEWHDKDETLLTGYAALRHTVGSDQKRWTLIIVHDFSNLNKSITDIAAIPSELLATLMLVLSVIAIILLRRHLDMRLSPLLSAAAKLAKNKKGARSNLVGADEFAEIGRAFDQMAEKVEQSLSELEDAKNDAELANLAKNNFLSFMSHEIQTPLAGLLGFIDLLGESELDEEARIYLRSTEASARTLSGLISNLLETSRLEAGTVKPASEAFCINSLIQDIVDSTIMQAKKKGLAIRVTSNQDDPIWLESDPVLIRKILVNLTDNAVRFTEEGSITIAVNSEPVDASRMLLNVSVSDTGIGIAPTEQKHLFDRFYRSNDQRIKNYKGAGIGLTICKDIADILHADIHVSSVLEEGSTFSLEMEVPIADPQSDFSYSALTAREQQPLNILLVEHSELTRSFLISLLKKLGHRVYPCKNASEAIQAMKDLLIYPNLPPIDLAFIDIHMPIMDGEETMHEIRGMDSRFKHLPMIATSTQNDPIAREKLLVAGFNGFVSKPINKEHLMEEIFNLSRLQTHRV
ncbi:response regulator [Kordiimonas sp. SCSIO 12603]|uniref:ATP-binding response regulator n=1 Tax=Kordiimonas sp. SCSIO 12603 TaxID=2829596 RepID=UPI002104BF14|nr:ATP-binding protein [Kordiimonas sp. SCSIO 12603]UTW59693.1 response regulator [Kordiimonas sp. SCSIO 12603]